MGKYFSAFARHAKAQEFLELKQGTMTMFKYMAKFTELAHYADDLCGHRHGLNEEVRGWSKIVHLG